MFSKETYDVSRDDDAIAAWQRAALVVAVIVSIVSGVAAFAFLTSTHAAEHRVTWVLLPPKAKSGAMSARTVAAANLLAARAIAQNGT